MTHAITDDTEEGTVFNIQSAIMAIGKREDCAVFGVLSCCRNDAPKHLIDGGPDLAEGTFKGAIVFGARQGDPQLSHSTLAL